MKDFRGMKRQRSRNRGKPSGGQSNNPNRAYESNGPEHSKVRGNAQTIYEKYQQLARDANSSGDRVLAENYLQHAEHYFRMIRLMQPQRPVSEFVQRDPFATSFDDYDEDVEPVEAPAEDAGEAAAGEEAATGEDRSRHNHRDNTRDRNRNRDRDNTRDPNRDPNRDQGRDPNREGGRRDRRDQYEQRRQQRLAEQEQAVAAPGFIASTEPLNGNGGAAAVEIQPELPAFLRAPRQSGPSSLVPESDEPAAPVKEVSAEAPKETVTGEEVAEPAPRRRGRPRRKSEDAVEA